MHASSRLANLCRYVGKIAGANVCYFLVEMTCFNPNAELVMTVSNLFDKTYRAQLETKYYSPFGEPRRMSIALRYRF